MGADINVQILSLAYVFMEKWHVIIATYVYEVQPIQVTCISLRKVTWCMDPYMLTITIQIVNIIITVYGKFSPNHQSIFKTCHFQDTEVSNFTSSKS